MVMEAATLSGPQRKYNVVPVQKSLSLPSYARAGGEGIDHRLIFAALEQKERVRRKSKIFTKEKTSRQNIFCLPISTGSKCRETDLSSDTSCSSLEYQKPKLSAKPKKEDSKQEAKTNENETKFNELKSTKTITQPNLKQVNTSTQPNLKKVDASKLIDLKSNADYGVITTQNVVNGGSSFRMNEQSRGHRSPVDTFRLNVGSSDSMDRSSRSSNDSLTRKERLVAIKARVEAEREKYGNSSSDDEARTNLTRYNSDGGIHKTVRDVKSRSYRNEKRLRRRSHGEWAIKKTDRKNNLSLCLNPEDDGIKLHLEKLNRLNNEINNLEVKTDFCPSPNVPENAKKYYFSDFPSKENVKKFVQQRIRHIEEEEQKRRSGSDFFDRIKLSQFNSFTPEKSTSIEHVNLCEKKALVSHCISDSRHGSSEFGQRASPTQRTKEAPTPPPRSPKSISIMNKTFLQHQNTTHSHLENDLNKKNSIQTHNFSFAQTKSSEKSPKLEVKFRNPKNSSQSQNNSAESRELFNVRRRTCNFDFVDEKVLNDLCSVLGTVGNSNLTASSNHSCSLNQIKNIDDKECSLNPEISHFAPLRNENKPLVNKFEENERRREFMFNSLENKKSSSSLSWSKWKAPPERNDTCICFLSPGNKFICKSKLHYSSSKNKNSENINSHDDIKNFESKTVLDASREGKKQLSSDNKNTAYSTRKTKIEQNLNHQKEKDSIDEDLAIQLQDLENNLKMADKNRCTSERNASPYVKYSTKINDFPSNERINFNAKNSNENLNCIANDSSATANLDSAMAELENVYLSLKLSSDNLSERNSMSNISLSEEDSKLFSKKPTKLPNTDMPSKRLSIHESNTYFDGIYFKDKNSNPSSTISKDESSSNTSKEVKEDDCLKDNSINELFKDLMPQLNTLEEKLRSHDSRYPKPTSCQRLNKLDNKPPDNCTSSIRFKKEFYENLQQKQDNFQRKKLAAQKLSENITNLMNSPTSQSKSNVLSDSHSHSQLVINKSANNSPSNSYKSLKINPWQNESNISETAYANRQSDKIDKPIKPFNPRQEEIRHIRVSMDSTPINSHPDSCKYSRLSSAVNSPHMSPKCDVAKPFAFTPNTSDSVDKTIDGLEELLNSLLVDVPGNSQSSLPSTEEPVSTTAPIASGEMCVMQHLDIIRLKPVPS